MEIVKKSVLFSKIIENGPTDIVKIIIDSFVKAALTNPVRTLAPGYLTPWKPPLKFLIDVFKVILDAFTKYFYEYRLDGRREEILQKLFGLS